MVKHALTTDTFWFNDTIESDKLFYFSAQLTNLFVGSWLTENWMKPEDSYPKPPG